MTLEHSIKDVVLNNIVKNIAIWVIIAVVLMTVFNQFAGKSGADTQMVYSQFINEVKQGHIAKVTIEGRVLRGETSDGKKFNSYAPYDPGMIGDLLDHNVKVEAKPEQEQSLLVSILINSFPMIILIGVWIFFM
ncbi:MAG: cell division protein, partial [Pseudomonadota bacterium]